MSTDQIVYLFLDNVNSDSYFCQIDLTKDSSKVCPKKYIIPEAVDLSDFIIKFKTSSNVLSEELYDFKSEPHKLYFKIGY